MYDVIILGSGPAGLTAAIYTSRAFLKTLVLTGIQDGGQLTTTTEIDNFPGFPKGIQGPLLMQDVKAQAIRFGAEIEGRQATGINKQEKNHTFVVTAGDTTFETKSIIVAMGASSLSLGISSEEKFRGRGVSYCATCDGFFFRGKEVVVVGGGDTAMEEAQFLTTFVTKVTVIHRRDVFRASPIMLKNAQENKKITFLTNKAIEEIIGDVSVTGVRLKDTVSGKTSAYATQGVFVAIGHKPNTEFLKSTIDLDQKGYVVVRGLMNPGDYHTATSVEGIFAAGDCVDYQYRQAIVAAGMGAMAAIDVQKWLEEKKQEK
jgi:thioredoxin reductase (NADPH)